MSVPACRKSFIVEVEFQTADEDDYMYAATCRVVEGGEV
jgi:hypothetical protein